MINENQVKDILDKILLEESSKVKRDDYNRVQYRIEELQNSLNETLKEFRKLNDALPDGLKTLSNGRVSNISNNLSNAQKLISQLKDKIKQHKRSTFSQRTEENKK
jgi:ABC-type transporter Mla subunit MlaD